MPELSNEIRRLDKRWNSGQGWPKRLEWIEVHGLRGWAGQRMDFAFPIVAIVGENGSGKSTFLQAAASAYLSDSRQETWFASDFFPDTAWDRVRKAEIKFGYAEGGSHKTSWVRKPTNRWNGNLDRPKRAVAYIDLSRIQPVGARVGYARIAKVKHEEKSARTFDTERVQRLSKILGREYESAKMALTNVDESREIPVIAKSGNTYSGFHQGSGEITIAELLKTDLPKYGLVLIDEIESSLHPRAQRRLVRELAEIAREREIQVILTTHSPFVLDELPFAARTYLMETRGTKRIVTGVSPQFAMAMMDDQPHPECELYVEDNAAKTLLQEVLAKHAQQHFQRCWIIPYGAANVGMALGQMVSQDRYPHNAIVFLDGDNSPAPGCILLPGDDAPERVVFTALKKIEFGNVYSRIGREVSWVSDHCTQAMTLADHHDWVRVAANGLMCGGDTLWQSMCAEWAAQVLKPKDVAEITAALEQRLS